MDTHALSLSLSTSLSLDLSLSRPLSTSLSTSLSRPLCWAGFKVVYGGRLDIDVTVKGPSHVIWEQHRSQTDSYRFNAPLVLQLLQAT